MSSSPRIEAAAERSELVRGACAMSNAIAVAELLAEHGFGDEVLAAALLHDVVEESETGVGEIRARFGEPVASLVDALTDEEAIEPYERRKDGHRRQVEDAGADALAIYAADKLANIRALRRVYAERGEAVGEELKAPLDV